MRLSARNRKKAFSTVIGSVLVLGMAFSILYGYFYFVSQGEQLQLNTSLQNSLASIQKSNEKFTVSASLIGPSLGFTVDNTGINLVIASYLITNTATGQVVQSNTGSNSNPTLPYSIGQGQSVTFNTGYLYPSGGAYTIKVLTTRGNTATALYPSLQPTLRAINSQIAAGLGSLSLNFSSFAFHVYTKTSGSYIIDKVDSYSGSLVPHETQVVFSLQITNNDPDLGSITINSHSDLFVYQQCTQGCGQQPLLVFYVINVASDGTITSTAKDSFQPMVIPYGSNTTLYFGSINDLSLGAFAPLSISGSHSYGFGENDVFLEITGATVYSQNAILYAQSIPFAASYVSDNIAYFSETPITCTHSALDTFTLTIANTKWSSYASVGNINLVTINASALTSATGTSSPNWKATGTGIITWTPTNPNKDIAIGSSETFTWTGTAPATIGEELILHITIGWDSGTVTTQQSSVGCYVN